VAAFGDVGWLLPFAWFGALCGGAIFALLSTLAITYVKEIVMSESPHALNWFEIPVSNFARAKAFYETVLGRAIEEMVMGPTKMGFLSSGPDAVGGAIVYADDAVPSKQGTIIYLNGGDNLAPMLARVVHAGGSIAVPKTEIGNDFGFFAHFIDTEGNKVGLHSML
jgi:uncharacterized protein